MFPPPAYARGLHKGFSDENPLVLNAGFINLKGNLFDSAIMKTRVISDAFRQRYLSNPDDLNAFEGRAIVFEGPEDYHHRLNDPALEIDEHCLLFIRGVGPIGYPGGAEVVNMQPPDHLIKRRWPPIRHQWVAIDSQCIARSGVEWRFGRATNQRQSPR